ncbi:MAG: nucleotide pyrophosphohydrolase [Nitriliruptor sp.]|nr:MAG: nucleotide pyrophosphohydrolase [Nitriliruptor sp.]
MSYDPLEELRSGLREFARERDWEQFHTPKNLAMALAGEVGELLEIFQWLTPEQANAVMESARADDVEDELADVAIYLVRLADVLGVDLAEVAQAKLDRNRGRFPPDHVRSRADVPPTRP